MNYCIYYDASNVEFDPANSPANPRVTLMATSVAKIFSPLQAKIDGSIVLSTLLTQLWLLCWEPFFPFSDISENIRRKV